MRVPEGLRIPCFSGFLRVSVPTQSEPKTWSKNPNEIKSLLVDFSPQPGPLHFLRMVCIWPQRPAVKSGVWPGLDDVRLLVVAEVFKPVEHLAANLEVGRPFLISSPALQA